MSDIGSWFGRKPVGASQSQDQLTSSQTSTNKPRRRRSGIMLLEPRMMYDGAGAATASHQHHHHHDAGADHAATGAASESNTATGAQTPTSGNASGSASSTEQSHSGTNASEPRAHVATWVKDPTEIVFIDAQVPDAQVLAQGAKAGVEVVMLDPNGDGVKQIADFLARHPDPNLATIDIVAHGADGIIQLGNTLLSSSNIGTYESQLAAIGNAMQAGGTIQIFGCDVAQDMTGDIFLAQLSAATGGKNIDASTHLVGAASEGGSWTLDVELNGGHGATKASTTPFTDATLAGYSDVLPDEIFVTSVGPSGVTADSTGTANNSATITATGTMVHPTYIAVDAAHNVFYVVDDQFGINSAKEQDIYVGAISGTLADGHKIDKIFSTPAVDFDVIGGIALDATTNTLYFAQSAQFEYNPASPNAHPLDQINGIFSLNLNNLNLSSTSGPGTLTETLVAYGPSLGIFQGDMAVDPINHKIYFIDDSTGGDASNSSGFDPNTSATNDIYVATIGSSPSLATSILHLAASDTITSSVAVGYTQGFLSGLALDVSSQTLYFSTWDLDDASHIAGGTAATDNVYKAAVSALGTSITGANVSTALLYSTAQVGQPLAVKVDVSSGQLYILNENSTSSSSGNEQGFILVGSVNGGTTTKIFEPAQSGAPSPSLDGFALDAAAVLTGSGATTTYSEGSSALHFESSAGISTSSNPGEKLDGATVSILGGFDANHDTLNFTNQNGITGSYSSTTGVLTLSGVASAASYAAALDSVTFSTDSASATQRTINLNVTDGSAVSNAVTDHINVQVPPTFSNTGNTVQFYQSTGTPQLLDSAITVSDASGANIASASVSIGSAVSGDTLTINGATSGTIAGTGISYSFSGSTLTLTGSDTAAHYQAALASVTYSFSGDPTNGGTNKVRNIAWSVTDANGLSNASGASTTLDVYAAPVVLVGANSPTPTVTGSSGPVTADPGLSITDNNGTSFANSATNATVTISGGFQTGDTLSDGGISGGGLVPGTANIHATYDSTTHTLTLTGADTVANYITALEEVQFNVTGQNAGTRTLSWQISDQAGGHTDNSVAVTSTVNAAFVNHAPTATAPGTDYSATEQVNLSLKNTGLSVNDVDGGSGIETVTLSVGEGILTGAAGNSGISIVGGNGTSSLVISGTIAQLNAFLGAGGTSTLVYNDNTDTPGTSTTLTLAINDNGNSGTGGSLSASASDVIDITAVNDAPAASARGVPYSATEQTSLDLKNTGLSVNDVDGLGGVETATLSVTEGTLTVTSGTSGASVSGSGTSTVTISGTTAQIDALLATDGTSTVSYIDGSDNPSASATLTLAINDNGNTGTGGAQSGSASAAIDITAVNDAPTASAPGTHYDATEQVNLSLKGTGLSVSDVDGGSGVETVTLSVGEGSLTGVVGDSGISIVSGNGTSSLVVAGTISELNAFLGTSGTSTLNYNDNTDTPGTSTTLTLAINDNGHTGIGGSLSANASDVIDITAVNDAPVAAAPGAPYAILEQTSLDLKNTGLSVNDVDGLGGVETATLSVTEGTLTVSAGTSGASVAGSGTSTVTITGTTAQIDALLATDATSTVSYIDGSDNPSASATLTLAINDNGHTGTGGAQSGSASVAIDITAVNDAPTASAPGTHYSASEQVDLSLKGTGLSVGDVDSGNGTETVTLAVGEGILTGSVGDSGVSIVSGNGTSSLVVSGTLAQLNAFLGIGGTSTLVYNDNTDTPGTSTTLTLSINDNGHTGIGGTLSANASATIDITAVNDAPVASVPGTDYSATEQTSLNLKNTGLSVNDVDGLGGVETATLSVTEGTLTVAAGTSGASVSGSGTSTVTISGTTAQIDALLATDATSTVSYVDNSDNPGASATLTLAINDNGHTGSGGAQSSHASVAIDITAVNDAPTASAPGTHYSASEQVDLSLKGTGLSVGDVDGNGGTETVTLSVGEGILTGAAGDSGISIVSGNGTSSLVVSGTIAQLNAFLGTGGTSTLIYNDNTDTPGTSTTVTLAISDGGNTGTGGALTANASATIDITAVNDAPTASAPAAHYGATEQTSLDLKNTGLSVNDVDGLGGTETATLSVTEGTLTLTAGTSGASVSGNGTSTVTISGTTAQIDALLNTDGSSTVSYIDNSDNPGASATLTLAINDNGHTGTGGAQSASASAVIDITAVNDAPTASAPGTHYGATEQVDLSLKNTGLSVGDVDGNGGTETVTLSVGEGILTGNVGDSGISIVSGNGSSSLVVSGTITQLNAFLGAGGTSTLVYNDNTDTPSAGTTLTLAVNDGGNTGTGGALSATASATIDITAVNDAPVASAPGTHYSATEQVSLDLKSTGLAVNDVDGLGGTETATLSVTEGTLTLTAGTSGASVSGSGTSTVTISGTTAQIDALLNTDGTSTVSYVDTSHNPATSATLSLVINDNGNTGTGGAHAASASATIDIIGVNDAPTASAPGAHYSATEQVNLSLKNTGLSVGDVDGSNGTETVTLSVGEGILTGTAGNSGVSIVSGNGTSSIVVSGTISQLNGFLGSDGTSTLVYNDNTDTPGTSTKLTLAINDNGHTGTGGALTGNATATIDIIAVNDAPVVTAGNSIHFDANNGGSGVPLDSSITVSDVDSSHLTGATIAISGNFTVGDKLSFVNQFGITGSYNATTGVLTLTGTDTIAHYQQALASITFSSNSQKNDPKTVTWTVTDLDETSPHHTATPLDATSVATTTTLDIRGQISPPPYRGDYGHHDDGHPGEGPGPGFFGMVTSVTGGGFSYTPASAIYVSHADIQVALGPDANLDLQVPLLALASALDGDVVAVEARMPDGSPLPSWLHFDGSTGKLAGLPPDDIVTGSIPANGGMDSGTPTKPADTKLTIEIIGRNAKGDISILTVTIDLGAGNNGTGTNHPGSPPPDRHGSLAPRDAGHRLGGLEGGRSHLAAAASAHDRQPIVAAVPAGRAGLTAQLNNAGWRAMHTDRMALLQSVRDTAGQWQ